MRKRTIAIFVALAILVGGAASAPAAVAVPLVDPSSVAVYRFFSPDFKGHFYTTSVAERDHIIESYPANVWTYEGAAYGAYTTQVPGTIPLYRFWSAEFRGHFFTTSEAEKTAVINNYPDETWLFEGIAYYVYPADSPEPDSRSVARFWSPTSRHHFYTANAEEAQIVKTRYAPSVWTYEIESFRVPSVAPAEVPVTVGPYALPFTFGDGQYTVGSQIPAGVYRSDNAPNCWWSRMDRFGSPISLTVAPIGSGPVLVEISTTDYNFRSNNCGQWRAIALHKPAAAVGQFGNGMWLVGVDIQPGRYSVAQKFFCHAERLSGLGGTEAEVIATAVASVAPTTVDVASTDVAVSSANCGTWTKIS